MFGAKRRAWYVIPAQEITYERSSFRKPGRAYTVFKRRV